MDKEKTIIKAEGVRIALSEEGREIARATLYLMTNDLHDRPFGLLEDVFVDESHRGKGVGSELVRDIISEAKNRNCYKLIATSRHCRENVHKLYEKLGFKNHGKEFRMDFEI